MRNNDTKLRTRSTGFTLVEPMVTVVIGTILLTIAIPAYNSQIRKSRRTEARTALLDLAGREESLFSTKNAYSSTATDVGYAAFPVTVGSGYYSLNVCVPATAAPCNGTAAAPSFQIVATPVAGKGQDKDSPCQTFTVDSTGVQASADGSSANTTSTCWK